MDREQKHPDWIPMAATFGEDLGPDPYAATDPAPSQRSSAVRHANRVKRQEAELAEYREQMAAHFEARRKAEAEDPLHGVPSSELHAAKVLRRRRDDPRPPGQRWEKIA